MSCCGHPNTCEQPCFHGGDARSKSWLCIDQGSREIAGVGVYVSQDFLDCVITGPSTYRVEWLLDNKPTLDEQCEAAMARLKAHIGSRCAEHREAIRANHAWDVRNMRERHAMTLDLIEMLRDDFPTPGPLKLLESLL